MWGSPIEIETGRYGVNRVPVEERLCEACNSVEDEFHVLMKCPLYMDVRGICFNSISAVSDVFADLSQESQFIELMSIRYIIKLFLILCTPFSTNNDICSICNNTNLHVPLVCIL